MDWDTVVQLYKPGLKVKTVIERIDYYGLFTSFKNGVSGYIKRSEALLTRKIVDLNNYFNVGQEIEALVLRPNPKYHNIELSIRQAELDPWPDYVKKNSVGSIVEGEVVLLTEKKAWIELQPGVIGLLPKNEIWMRAQRVDDVFMIDDRVRAQITEINEKEKILLLSIRALFKDEIDQREETATYTIEESLSEALEIFHWEQTKQTTRDIGLSDLCLKNFNKIIIIDKNEAMAFPLSLMLEGFGFQCELLIYESTIWPKLKEKQFNLIIISADLTDENQLVAVKIKKLFPELKIIVYGTNEHIEPITPTLAANGLYGYVLKIPHSSSDLVEMLNQLAHGEPEHDLIVKKQVPISPLPEHKQETLGFDEKDMTHLLDQIKELTSASFAIIFEMNLNSSEVSIFAASGKQFDLSDFDKGHLQFSPIRDVIINKALINEPKRGEKFKYLRCLGHFVSVIGQRISFSDESGYALFLFGEREKQFYKIDTTVFSIYELALRSVLERTKFWETRKDEQKFITVGKLTSNLVHELKNLLQAMLYWLEVLKTDSVNLNSGKLKPTDKVFLARFAKSVDNLLNLEKRSRSIEELFLNLLRKEEQKTVDVSEFVNNFLDTLMPIAQKQKISIEKPKTTGLTIQANVSYLNQILINLFLNSMDFIPNIRKRTGRIRVSINQKKEEPLPLKLEFWDNGPGINERQKERVFDMLFTTKPAGSGLGLYIARGLAESMDGKLYVKDTIRLSETTFVLELPASSKGGH